MEKIVEGRRSNVVYILGQIKGFLETLKGIEGYNIASIHDIVARQFAQALSEAGASDPYAVIRAVDEVSRVRGTGPIYTRIYRKYFHAPVTMSPEEANVAAEQGFEDGVEEVSTDDEVLSGDEDVDYWKQPGFEGDSEHPGYLDPEWAEERTTASDFPDDYDDTPGDWHDPDDWMSDGNGLNDYGEPEDNMGTLFSDNPLSKKKESIQSFLEGTDNFSQAYEAANELIYKEAWTREAVEVHLRDEYKLGPEDVNAIVEAVVNHK